MESARIGVPAMSAEQIKAAVREYANETRPGGWRIASVTVVFGGPDEYERLVVTPESSDPEPPAPPPTAAS